jgi:hypothetical protein
MLSLGAMVTEVAGPIVLAAADVGSDLAEHSGTLFPLLISIIGVLLTALAIITWRSQCRLEGKIDAFQSTQAACQKDLARDYVRWDTLNERILDPILKDRKDRWHEFDTHTHDPSSGIVIKK